MEDTLLEEDIHS